MRLVVQEQTTSPVAVSNDAANGSLGGGAARRLGSPIDLRLIAQNIASGNEVAMPDAIRDLTVFVILPVLAEQSGQSGQSGQGPGAGSTGSADPGRRFAWLMEVQEDGQFLGYLPIDGTYDAPSNTMIYELPLSALSGTLFLPVMMQTAWVTTFDPGVHIWSSPYKTAVDFGEAAPQFTSLQVVWPQVGGRIFVFNPTTNNYGWVDAAGVGPGAGS